jgi:hypothetical protein
MSSARGASFDSSLHSTTVGAHAASSLDHAVHIDGFSTVDTSEKQLHRIDAHDEDAAGNDAEDVQLLSTRRDDQTRAEDHTKRGTHAAQRVCAT